MRHNAHLQAVASKLYSFYIESILAPAYPSVLSTDNFLVIVVLTAFSWILIAYKLFLSSLQITKIILGSAAIMPFKLSPVSPFLLLVASMSTPCYASPDILARNEPSPLHFGNPSLVIASDNVTLPGSSIFGHLIQPRGLISGAKPWQIIVFGFMEGVMILSVGGAYGKSNIRPKITLSS
jgi:hypothetical protein